MIRSRAPVAPESTSLSSTTAAIPFSSQFVRAKRSAERLTSSSWTDPAREASNRPPAPVPQPTSARAPIRGGARDWTNEANRYVSGPRKTASAAVVGYAEWASRSGPRDEKRTPLRSSGPALSTAPASSSKSNKRCGRAPRTKGRLQPKTSRRVRASPPRASTRRCVSGVGVTNAYPAAASAWPSLASGSTGRDATASDGRRLQIGEAIHEAGGHQVHVRVVGAGECIGAGGGHLVEERVLEGRVGAQVGKDLVAGSNRKCPAARVRQRGMNGVGRLLGDAAQEAAAKRERRQEARLGVLGAEPVDPGIVVAARDGDGEALLPDVLVLTVHAPALEVPAPHQLEVGHDVIGEPDVEVIGHGQLLARRLVLQRGCERRGNVLEVRVPIQRQRRLVAVGDPQGERDAFRSMDLGGETKAKAVTGKAESGGARRADEVELLREIFRDPVVEKAGAELEQRVRLDGRAHLRQPRFLLHRLDPSGPRPSLWPEQRTPTRDEDGGADPVRHPVRKLVAVGDGDLRGDVRLLVDRPGAERRIGPGGAVVEHLQIASEPEPLLAGQRRRIGMGRFGSVLRGYGGLR